jgi:hypothetical protein
VASGGAPNVGVFVYGLPGWKPTTGDWRGTGTSGIGAVDPSGTLYLRSEASTGTPDAGVFAYGLGTWTDLGGTFASTTQPLSAAGSDDLLQAMLLGILPQKQSVDPLDAAFESLS